MLLTMDIGGLFGMLLGIGYAALILTYIILLVLENRQPEKAIPWIVILLFLPFLGFILYIFFGQTYRKQKIFSRKGLKTVELSKRLSTEQLEHLGDEVDMPVGVDSKWIGLVQLILRNSHSIITNDNKVDLFFNGKDTFDNIFEAIASAERFIHIEYYILEDDELGEKLSDCLIEKVKEGVEVRLLHDDVGSWNTSNRFWKKMKTGGVQVHAFMPVAFPAFTSKVNYRNHRKILIVDGEVGFLGGMNIASRYIDGLKKIGCWRDTQVRFEGNAVSSLQRIFVNDWYFTTHESLVTKNYFPPQESRGHVKMQVLGSGPDTDWKSIHQAQFFAIMGAKRQILLTTPYFMPTLETLEALRTAALSGVDVRILIPYKSDAHMAQWCTLSYVKSLLAVGCRVFQYQKGFVHAKTLVVDGVISSVGSANFDFRSFEQNFEVNTIVYDRLFASKLILQFEQDMQDSKEITVGDWQKRNPRDRMKSSFARLFAPLF